jgi:hypothetical protein
MGARTYIATLFLQMIVGFDGHAAETPPASTPAGAAAGIPFVANILVDQFGYRPNDPKVAVIRNPHVGYDNAQRFVPGSSYQVRRVSDGSVAFSGALTQWNLGAIEASSGDSGWWFDFSSVVTPGTYFIYDKNNNSRSAIFHIDQQVYKNILKAAMRMYFYQRSGFAKQPPYADECWKDAPAYIGPGQDTEARDVSDRNNVGKIRNLTGGWFDAGDTNKYVTFAAPAVHQLLTAYQDSPSVFTDDFNIPESGNGIPDVLDEVRWETDWLKRMQYPDGSAALKVGEIVDALAAPPSSDRNARFYVPSCTSATIAVAGMFAHASLVFASIPPLAAESVLLRARAKAAWRNYQSIGSKQTQCDTGAVRAGHADWNEQEQNSEAVVAAVYLFAITDEIEYASYVAAHYRELRPYRDMGWSRYNPEQGEALLFFTNLPNVDPKLRQTIRSDKLSDVRAGNHIYGFSPEDDLYRAYMHDAQYHWGSNNPRADYGNSNLDVLTYKLDVANPEAYRIRALEILHYFHGVNPLGMVYLSNMSRYGATRSANEIYHAWFTHGSRWSDSSNSACGPAPGYVPAGPNVFAVRDGVPNTLSPPAGQPAQKSYRDWNVGWPESSWTITEPGIYYQSAYVELLSKFAE